jgi:hypothetical protein
MGITRERIAYSLGNEHNPGDPFGRDSLVIEIDGRARLDHFGGKIGRAAWTATVTQGALDSLWSAIERSSFPEYPMQVVPPGASFHGLTVGAGPASSRSASLYIYGAIPPGYDEAITIFSAIVRQMSDPADASPPAARKVIDVTSIDARDPRCATPPSPGTAFLLAYLSARRVTQVARRELLDRHAATAAVRKTVDAEQDAADRSDSFLWRIANALEIAIPPPPRQPEADDSTKTWLTDIATAVRPRLTSPELESAWHAGEAARLFSVCLGLEATVAELRGAAPDDAELRARAVELGRDRAESFATLKARLEATNEPLVVDQANRLARPDTAASDVPVIFAETARAFDGVPPPPPDPNGRRRSLLL